MAAPRNGPCSDWVTLEDVRACSRCSDEGTVSDEAIESAIAQASEILFHLSGRQFSGECEGEVRPCARSSWYPIPQWWRNTFSRYGMNSNYSSYWGICLSNHEPWRDGGCGSISELKLGVEILREVTQVKIDGAVIPATDYRVDDYGYLVRIEPAGYGWPTCQDLRLPDTDPNTWSVQFTYGKDIPESGQRAAIDLACELALLCAGGDCRLPERITNISRQGISMTVLDPFDFLERGKVGIYSVDLFLRTFNPNNRTRRAVIASPDVGARVRRTDT
jgi:hypothetical protein